MLRKLILLLAVLFITGFAEGAVLEDVIPGEVTVELGDGYNLSVTLSDAVDAYDIETVYTESIKSYDVYIRPSDSDESLLDIMFFVYETPQSFPKYEETERIGPFTESDGPSVTMPATIDNAEGHVFYSYPANNPGTDPNQANGATFKYYPGAKVATYGDDLEGRYEVAGDTMGAALTDTRAIPVFKEVINTIHISGIQDM